MRTGASSVIRIVVAGGASRSPRSHRPSHVCRSSEKVRQSRDGDALSRERSGQTRKQSERQSFSLVARLSTQTCRKKRHVFATRPTSAEERNPPIT